MLPRYIPILTERYIVMFCIDLTAVIIAGYHFAAILISPESPG
jgi:hypothetical protein